MTRASQLNDVCFCCSRRARPPTPASTRDTPLPCRRTFNSAVRDSRALAGLALNNSPTQELVARPIARTPDQQRRRSEGITSQQAWGAISSDRIDGIDDQPAWLLIRCRRVVAEPLAGAVAGETAWSPGSKSTLSPWKLIYLTSRLKISVRSYSTAHIVQSVTPSPLAQQSCSPLPLSNRGQTDRIDERTQPLKPKIMHNLNTY